MTLIQSPYLREQRQFPNTDIKELSNQSDHAYIDIAQKVNVRTIGIHALNFSVVNGESWYLLGSSQKQQALRQIYTFYGITGATQANPAVLSIADSNFTKGQSIYINSVQGMTQLNGNTYTIISVTSTTVTIDVDSTGFGAYTGSGVAIPPHNAFSVDKFSPKSYGEFTDGTSSYGAIFASNVPIAGQVTFYVTHSVGSTSGNIVIQVDATAPTILNGIINLEWLSQV